MKEEVDDKQQATGEKAQAPAISHPMKGLLGRKLGMTQIFGEEGEWIPVTVLEGGPCFILSVKTKTRDGYDAIQLGFEEAKEKSRSKPELGFFKKSGVSPKRIVREIRLPKAGEFQVGQSHPHRPAQVLPMLPSASRGQ